MLIHLNERNTYNTNNVILEHCHYVFDNVINAGRMKAEKQITNVSETFL